MKALVSEVVGGPETLVITDLPEPSPGDNQIKIKVAAAGVNFPDSLIITDQYQFSAQRPFAPGSEASGIVVALGSGVSDFKVGDRVTGMMLWGAMAEYALLDAHLAAKIPDTMPLETAAALPVVYGTSYHALVDRGTLKAGETLLVLGASGGTGLAAIEIGKALGARVLAAASSQEKLDLALSHGAQAGMVYPKGPFDKAGLKDLAAAFKNATGSSGTDVIYDPVGGDYTLAAIRSIAWGGRFLVVGFPAGIPQLPLNLTLLKGCQVVGVFYGAHLSKDTSQFRSTMHKLFDLWRAGQIAPCIAARFPLDKAGEAITALANRSASGKLIVIS